MEVESKVSNSDASTIQLFFSTTEYKIPAIPESIDKSKIQLPKSALIAIVGCPSLVMT